MIQLAKAKTADGGQPPTQKSPQLGERIEGRSPVSQVGDRPAAKPPDPSPVVRHPAPSIALLTGGGDKPYAIGMATALTSAGLQMDFIGSDELSVTELVNSRLVTFLNLRGDQRPEVSVGMKIARVVTYYCRLIRYAATAKPKLFHILWNNKFELFDRTLLMLYYKLLGKNIVLTAHNVNARKRDANDSVLNRLSLRIQYGLTDHIFVHTKRMKSELVADFRVRDEKVSVIPFGINNTVPDTELTPAEAKRQLGINSRDKTMLFFGNIAPYKGLEYLIGAFSEVLKQDRRYRLIIAGRPKGPEHYWTQLERSILCNGLGNRVVERIEYIADEETELYFKAADVLVLPYTRIFQSGVLLLGYSFGLPALAADVGSLRDEIVEGETGFVFEAENPLDLAEAIRRYFESDLYLQLNDRRSHIREYASDHYSWSKVTAIAGPVYQQLLGQELFRPGTSQVSK